MTDANTVTRSPQHLCWVPIRALTARHRPRVLQHLLELEPDARYLRFGHHATDAQIARYVDALDFEADDVLGVFDRRLTLIAMAHLACLPRTDQGRRAEFGVSVLAKARGRGLGARLFDRAVLLARNRQVNSLVIHALAENKAMLHIARQAGATIERDGADAQAELSLPEESSASHLEADLARRIAELDFDWKRQAKRLNRLLSRSLGRVARLRGPWRRDDGPVAP